MFIENMFCLRIIVNFEVEIFLSNDQNFFEISHFFLCFLDPNFLAIMLLLLLIENNNGNSITQKLTITYENFKFDHWASPFAPYLYDVCLHKAPCFDISCLRFQA
jgi:hypothetical protein